MQLIQDIFDRSSLRYTTFKIVFMMVFTSSKSDRTPLGAACEPFHFPRSFLAPHCPHLQNEQPPLPLGRVTTHICWDRHLKPPSIRACTVSTNPFDTAVYWAVHPCSSSSGCAPLDSKKMLIVNLVDPQLHPTVF